MALRGRRCWLDSYARLRIVSSRSVGLGTGGTHIATASEGHRTECMRRIRLFAAWLVSLYRQWTRPLPLGLRGENAAAKFLRRQGYVIVAQQQHDHRLGEIDIIAAKDRTVVFVEVKTRTSQSAGNPAEAVDQHKRERMQRVALKFLKRKDLLSIRARFDIIAVTWPDLQKPPQIEHFENAFEPSGSGQMFS